MRDIIVLGSCVTAENIASIDLRAAAERADSAGLPWHGERLLIEGQSADLVEIDGRVGLAWGSDAVWGDACGDETVSETVERLLQG